MKTLLITGASGYLAGEIFNQLKHNEQVELIGISRHLGDLPEHYPNVKFYTNEDLLNGVAIIPQVDVIIHSAFCRLSAGKQLVDSLNFGRMIVHWAINNHVSGFINLSSQSVFGSENRGYIPKEEDYMGPGYMYALAKCASELLMEEIAKDSISFTSIRLASLLGPSGSVPKNVLYKFIQSGLSGEKFKVTGGKQNFSFLDVRDAADAIIRFCSYPMELWDKAYNLGPEKRTNILAMADCVCEKVGAVSGTKITYEFTPDDTKLDAGMDSSKIYDALNWKPRYSFEKIVEDTTNFIMESENH